MHPTAANLANEISARNELCGCALREKLERCGNLFVLKPELKQGRDHAVAMRTAINEVVLLNLGLKGGRKRLEKVGCGIVGSHSDAHSLRAQIRLRTDLGFQPGGQLSQPAQVNTCIRAAVAKPYWLGLHRTVAGDNLFVARKIHCAGN